MKEFFLLLFLAKSIAITTELIDISYSVRFLLTEPVSAITSGKNVILDNVSPSANGKSAELVISSSSGLQTGIEFSELTIESSMKLSGVSASWQNYSRQSS
jgi:hypothetical protein